MGCTASPTASGQITSRYGIRPGRTSGAPTFHAGWDMRGVTGDPVFAAADGIVESIVRNDGSGESTRAGFNSRAFRGYGNVVILYHPHLGTWTSYNHLSAISVRVGQNVRARQPIGAVGNSTTGKFPGMGAHLHFEVRHATRDGQSPFPGPYGAYNIDPSVWFTQNGSVDQRGILVAQATPCFPAAGQASYWQSVGTRMSKAPGGSEYEPPAGVGSSGSPAVVIGVLAIGAAALFLMKKRGLAGLDALLKTEREIAAKRFVSVEYCDYHHGTGEESCYEAWRGPLVEFLEQNEETLTSDEVAAYLNMKPTEVISGGGGAMVRYKVKRLR